MKNNYTEHILSKIGMLCIVAAIFTCLSCEKDVVDKFTPLEENWSSIDEFIGNTESYNTINIANAAMEIVFETEIATYKIPQATIQDQSGSTISGPISLEITELRNPGEYILSNLNTKDIVGDIIHKHFACKIELKKGNQLLTLNNDKPIEVFLKGTDTTIDTESTFEWINDSNFQGWFPTNELSVESKNWDFYSNDVHYVGSGYKMKISKTGWFSMGDFEIQLYPNATDFGNLTINIPSEFDNFDTQIFAVHSSNTTVISIDKNAEIYSHGQILKDEIIRIVGLTTVNGKLYFARKDFSAGEINEYDLNFEQLAYFELIEELKRL